MKKIVCVIILIFSLAGRDVTAQNLTQQQQVDLLTSLINDISYKKLLKAKSLARLISYESKKMGVNPLMVIAIIQVESAFKYRAVSKAGAMGLMQVMPKTGRAVASQLRWMRYRGHDLFIPAKNLRLGIRYFRDMKQRFRHNKVLALTAYNFGPTRVMRFQRNKTLKWRHLGYAHKVLKHFDFLSRQKKKWMVHNFISPRVAISK